MSAVYKKYKRDDPHSYTLGPFPTFELLACQPSRALEVLIREDFNEREKLEALCREKGVKYTYSQKTLDRISSKEACYAAGVFQKYTSALRPEAPHVVLNNPSDMGNLGTILRTLLGFGLKDLAIITPAADLFHPKVVRASMGALFHMNFALFESFEAYLERYGQGRDLFPFMLDGERVLSLRDCPCSEKYALIFGNEASGLPPSFSRYGTSIFIPQSDEVDSLNLAVSVAVGAFLFTSVNRRDP